jgi:hypothetical protein
MQHDGKTLARSPSRQRYLSLFRSIDRSGLDREGSRFAHHQTAAARLPEDVYRSLNGSPGTLARPDLLERLLSGLVGPTRLVVEVTEHADIAGFGDLGVSGVSTVSGVAGGATFRQRYGSVVEDRRCEGIRARR